MKKFLITLLLFFFTLPAFAENTILVIGDSISAGYGINPKQGWTTLLQQKLKQENYNYHVINASISGDTTSNGLARLPQALNKYSPKITIVELGGNDGLRGLAVNQIKRNLSRMILLIKQKHSNVLVLGVRLPPNYGQTYTQQFQQIFHDLEKQYKIIVIPNFLINVDDQPKLMQSDGIHPTLNAQSILLNNIWPTLQSLLNNTDHKQ